MSNSEYCTQLTQCIIEQLEAGTAPWQKPWDPSRVLSTMPTNAVTNRAYHGGNRLWLDCQGYADNRWCTYKQAQANGWQVQKGERASVVEYWQWEREQPDASGALKLVKLDVPRVFYARVFNVTQMEGVPEIASPLPVADTFERHEAAERLLTQSGASILHDQKNNAFYNPKADQIHLPPKQVFTAESRYYATAIHELGHWSGHSSRLNRDLQNTFGSEDYAREELRAELASYFVCSKLCLSHDPGPHASYINSWIQVLKADHNEVFRAARDAENISEYLLTFSQELQTSLDSETGKTSQLDWELSC